MEEGMRRGRSSSWGHRSSCSPLLGAPVLSLCVVVACAPVVLAGPEPPPPSEQCAVELFQSQYGIHRGHLIQGSDKTGQKVSAEERRTGTNSSANAGILALLDIEALTEVAKSSSVAWTILVVGLALPALVQAAVLYLGRLPPPHEDSEHHESRFPASSVLIFSCIVRIGMMANITVILPFAASMSTSSGQGSDDSGYIIAVTSVGSIAGLLFFWSLTVQQLRLSYLCHGIIMFLGNACWALAGHIHSFTLMAVARVIVGLEGGVAYNTSLSLAHHAKGDGMTTCFFIIQFCQEVGVLMGPVVAAFPSWVMQSSGSKSMQLQEEAGTLFMASWGLLLVAALLIQGPLPDPPDIEDKRCSTEVEVPHEARGQGVSTPDADGHLKDERSALGLLLVIIGTGYLRSLQRVLFESGMIYILQTYYQWSSETSGLVMLPTIAYCAILEALLVTVVKGVFSDRTLVCAFEIKQLLACMLMLYGAWTEAPNSVPICLIIGGVVLYGANGLCGSALIPLCLKRSIPNSVGSREALVLGSSASIFIGSFFGALGSRVVIGESPSPFALVLLMLGTCCCQIIVTYLSLEMTGTDEAKA